MHIFCDCSIKYFKYTKQFIRLYCALEVTKNLKPPISSTMFCLFGKHPDGRILHHFQSRPRDRRSDCAVALTLHTKYRPPSFLFFTASHHGLESVAGHGSTEQKLVAHSVGSFFQRQRASTVAWKTSVYSGSWWILASCHSIVSLGLFKVSYW